MPIKYNYLDNNDKYAQLYRLQELLRLEHNSYGLQFKQGTITQKDWNNYKNQFNIKNDLLSLEICKIRQLIKDDNTINTTLNDILNDIS